MIKINVNKIPDSLDAIDDICLSKYFKRLSDKTQMIETRISEHYRTRLTHTLEVMSIANTICDRVNDLISEKYTSLKVDKNIVLATALAHDIGHTPYGHIGEQTIKKMLEDTGYLFKHNINSIKILLEDNKRANRTPLEVYPYNLDWQIIDGVLKHTKVFPVNYQKKCNDPYDLGAYLKNHPVYASDDFKFFIKNFLCNNSNDFLDSYLDYPYPLTLSGQIIAIADEIAQRVSDFDDTIRILKKRNIKRMASSKIFKDLLNRLNYVYITLNSLEDIKKTKTCKSTINYCKHILKLLDESQNNDELSFMNIVNRTRNYYIENLIENFKNKILEDKFYDVLSINYRTEKEDKIVNYILIKSKDENQFICFDQFVEQVRKTMSEFSYQQVHGSKEIKRGNSKGEKYIKKWFNHCIKDFTLCDNKVKRNLIQLYSDMYETDFHTSKIEDAFSEYNKNDNDLYTNKCKLIILEGISYMSNNYLSNKVLEFKAKNN